MPLNKNPNKRKTGHAKGRAAIAKTRDKKMPRASQTVDAVAVARANRTHQTKRPDQEFTDEQLMSVLALRFKLQSNEQIAEALGLGLNTIELAIGELNRELRAEFHDFDWPLFCGQTQRTYDVAKAALMEIIQDTSAGAGETILAVKALLQVEGNRQLFFNRLGYFERFKLEGTAAASKVDASDTEKEHAEITTDADDLAAFLMVLKRKSPEKVVRDVTPDAEKVPH